MSKGMNIWFIISFVILFSVAGIYTISDSETIETDCYDRSGNKIEELTYQKTILVQPYRSIETSLFILLILNLFITPLILIKIQDYLDTQVHKKEVGGKQ